MNFECQEIEISDNEFGCTVSFSDRKINPEDQILTNFDDIIESIGQYVLLQRSYPEEDFESECFHIEISNSDQIDENEYFKINLTRTTFKLIYRDKKIEIGINTLDREFTKLKKVLTRIIDGDGELIIQE